MHDTPFHNPSLTVAIAMFAGVIAFVLARALQLPGIVILLATGVLLGPDVAGVIEPSSLGEGLLGLVGFAVAIILFEGGLALNLRRLFRAARPVRQLVTLGAVVTAVGGTMVARLLMDWDWRTSILFGTLVIVTGPTVITPLLRRLKVERGVATVLEAEGVLIDAVGAVVAAVALEVALSPTEANLAAGFIHVGGRLALGTVLGFAGGGLLSLLLSRRVVPEGLTNVLTLAFVLALFQGSNAMMHESGIAAVTVAGIVVGRAHSPVHKDLHHFKEQLTTMLIGMLFILLAADVRISQVIALGWPGALVVLSMMFIVRPINVLVGTWGASLNWRQRVFMAWIGPRGIIAAAVASMFSVKLQAAGIEGGVQLRALVFMVITMTVLSAGLTGGLLARVLSLKRKSNQGWLFMGANELAVEMAQALQLHGEEVVAIESSSHKAQAADRAGIKVVFGNALEERTLLRADAESRAGALCLTSSEETNLLFANKAKREGHTPKVLLALDSLDRGVTEAMVAEAGAGVLFGSPQIVALWSVRIRRGLTERSVWRLKGEPLAGKAMKSEGLFLPLVYVRDGKAAPISDQSELQAEDQLTLLLFTERLEAAKTLLGSQGFLPEVNETSS